METIKIDTENAEWDDFITSIVNSFNPGELISHEYLKNVLSISETDINDFENTDEFIKVFQKKQYEYMALIAKIRSDLLLNECYYLENIEGKGYRLMPPKDQHEYAYRLALKNIRSAIKNAVLIMTYVKNNALDHETRAKGSNLIAKISHISQLFNTVKKY